MTIVLTAALCIVSALFTPAQTASARAATGVNPMSDMHEATGAFEVKMAPYEHTVDASISAFSMDKTYSGALKATAKGEMLAGGDRKTGHAGYVALEVVNGTLDGKTGSFALMHTATMAKGTAPEMSVRIVPGSGTGELSGIYGTLLIHIAADGSHSYTLRYAFSAQ